MAGEGVALGREGPLTLFLVGTFYGKVYAFDCLVNNELFDKGGLRLLLENTKVLKVSCNFKRTKKILMPPTQTIILNLISCFR